MEKENRKKAILKKTNTDHKFLYQYDILLSYCGLFLVLKMRNCIWSVKKPYKWFTQELGNTIITNDKKRQEKCI